IWPSTSITIFKEPVAPEGVLAPKVCGACQLVAPDYQFGPTLRQPAPSFQAIANRRCKGAESEAPPQGKNHEPNLSGQHRLQAVVQRACRVELVQCHRRHNDVPEGKLPLREFA